MQILDLLAIATPICPVFTRKHLTAQISHKYHDKKSRKADKKYKNNAHMYLQASCAKIRSKMTRRVKKAENSPALTLVQAKKSL